MGGACSAYRKGERRVQDFGRKPGGKRPLGEPMCRWDDNIKLDLHEVGCGVMDWIDVAQDRDRWRALVNAIINLRGPYNEGNFLTSCKLVSLPRRALPH
jgi:hypothetical protein